jgi:hypothetical protein
MPLLHLATAVITLNKIMAIAPEKADAAASPSAL